MSGIIEIPLMLAFGGVAATAIGSVVNAVSETFEYNRSTHVNRTNSQFENLNKKLNKEIEGLNDEIRILSREHTKKLREQAAAFDKSVDELRFQMAQNYSEMQKSIKNIMDSIEKKENNHKKIAQFWIDQTCAFINDIENYKHEQFAPNKLEYLKMQLNQIRKDMENEAYQSAISGARTLFHQVMEFREIVMNKEIEWVHYYEQMQKMQEEIENKVNENRNLQFIYETEDNRQEKINAEIDFWTDNELSLAEADYKKICDGVKNSDDITIEQMIKAIEQMNGIILRLIELPEKTKNIIFYSNLRAETANMIADTLERAGWQCTGCTYEEENQKKSVHIKLEDGNGNEIVSVISPDKINDKLINKLSIHFFDNYNNDEAMREIWADSIRQVLNENGINTGETKCVEGYEHCMSDKIELKNIEKTASKKAE